MITFSVWRTRSVRRAFGALTLGAAMLVAAISSGTTLRATQDESPAVAEAALLELTIPNDLSDEYIEGLDAELSKKISPQLATLFDVSQSSDARKAAAAELEASAGQMSTASTELQTLKRRLLRRVNLIRSSIIASEIPGGTPAPIAPSTQLTNAVIKAQNSLSRIKNGNLWADYLHLSELRNGQAPMAVLKQVLRNATPTEAMTREQVVFTGRSEIQALKVAVESTVAVSTPPGDEAAARAEQQKLVHGLVTSMLAYEKEPLTPAADAARSAWRVLRSRYPAAADAMRGVVNHHYLNHNIHFTVSEDLLSRLISDYRTESGCIADCILGASVTGSQTTNVNVAVDIKPSTTSANFDLNVSGNTHSNTKAVKSPATVWTSGNHYFWINRSVFFDGRHIMATPASFSVDTNSRTVGLATKFDGIPIIRGIVRNIANQKIAESKPQSDAITRTKLRDEAVPKFESETNEQFSSGNETLRKMLDSLERRGVAPDSISARSSNTQVAVSSRTIGVARLGGSIQPPAALLSTGAAAQIHHSALNNAIDALGFQGRDVAEKDFVKEMEAALTDLFQREIDFKDEEPEPVKPGEEPEPPSVFVFSKSDPIRVRFEKGQVIVVLRTGIRQEGREEIPEQTITIPISLTLENGKVILDPGNIAVGGTDNARKVQIKRILSRRVVRRELSATIDLQAAGDKTLPVTINYLELADGWLTAEIQ